MERRVFWLDCDLNRHPSTNYNWPLNNTGVMGADTHSTENPTQNCWLYSWSFALTDSTKFRWQTVFLIHCLECETTVFYPHFVECVYAKPTDRKSWLYLLKKVAYKWTCTVQTPVVQGSIVNSDKKRIFIQNPKSFRVNTMCQVLRKGWLCPLPHLYETTPSIFGDTPEHYLRLSGGPQEMPKHWSMGEGVQAHNIPVGNESVQLTVYSWATKHHN